MQRLTAWEAVPVRRRRLLQNVSGLGAVGASMSNVSKLMDEEQRLNIARGTRTEYYLEMMSRLNRGESSVLNV